MIDKEQNTFSIKRIKEFSFLVNESLAVIDKPVHIQFQHKTSYYGDRDLIDLTLRVFYSYDKKIPPDTILIDLHVQNLFEVKDLIQYQNSNLEYVLPENLIVSMLSVSISHLRALMAKNVAGTPYQQNIVPIVNPVEVAKEFYPNMFIGKFDVKSLEEKVKRLPKSGKKFPSKNSY